MSCSFSAWKDNCKCFIIFQNKLVYFIPFRNDLKIYIYSVAITNEMQLGNGIYYSIVHWKFPLRLDYGRSPHAYVNQRLQIQLGLLMMSDMPLETCWAFNVLWNNKFRYRVACCWLLLLSHTTMHGSMNTKFTFTVLCNLLHSVDVTIILVSSAYNMLCESLSVILRDYLYIYIEQHWAQDRTFRNSTLYWLPIWPKAVRCCAV